WIKDAIKKIDSPEVQQTVEKNTLAIIDALERIFKDEMLTDEELKSMGKKYEEFGMLIKDGFLKGLDPGKFKNIADKILDAFTPRSDKYEKVKQNFAIPFETFIRQEEALETVADQWAYLQNQIGQAATQLSSLRNETRKSEEELNSLSKTELSALKTTSLMIFSKEEYEKAIRSAYKSLFEAEEKLRDYGVTLKKDRNLTVDFTKSIIEMELEFKRLSGSESSIFDVKLRGLRAAVRQLYDASITLRSNLNQLLQKGTVDAKVFNALDMMRSKMKDIIKEQIEQLKTQKEAGKDVEHQLKQTEKALEMIQKQDLSEILAGDKIDTAALKDLMDTFVSMEKMTQAEADALQKTVTQLLEAKKVEDARKKIAQALLNIFMAMVNADYKAASSRIQFTLEEKRAYEEYKRTIEKGYETYKNLLSIASKAVESLKNPFDIITKNIEIMQQKVTAARDIWKEFNSIIVTYNIDTSTEVWEKLQQDIKNIDILSASWRSELENSLKILGLQQEQMDEILNQVDLIRQRHLDEIEAKKQSLKISQAQTTVLTALEKKQNILLEQVSKYKELRRASIFDEKRSYAQVLNTELDTLEQERKIVQSILKERLNRMKEIYSSNAEIIKVLEEQYQISSQLVDADYKRKKFAIELNTLISYLTQQFEQQKEAANKIASTFASNLNKTINIYTSNLEKAQSVHEDIVKQQENIAKLQEQLNQETDPEKQAQIRSEISKAREELERLVEEEKRLKSVGEAIKQTFANIAKDLADIVIQVNTKQMEQALGELLYGSKWGQNLASVFNENMLAGLDVSANNLYDAILTSSQEGALEIYNAIITASTEAGSELASLRLSLTPSTTTTPGLPTTTTPTAAAPAPVAISATSAPLSIDLSPISALNTTITKLIATLESLNLTEKMLNDSIIMLRGALLSASTNINQLGTDIDSTSVTDAAGTLATRTVSLEKQVAALKLQIEQLQTALSQNNKSITTSTKLTTISANIQRNAAKELAASMAKLGATMLAVKMFGGGQGAATGAQLGATLGQLAFQQIPFVGSLLGTFVGGFIGSLFDKKKTTPELPKETTTTRSVIAATQTSESLNSNTEALKANTVSLQRLSIALDSIKEKLINAPTRFSMPPMILGGQIYGYAGSAPGAPTIVFNVNGNLDQNVANDIMSKISQLYQQSYTRQGYVTSI
ncbi:MAG: hypothetical protein DRI86_16195, partial [Bacteroidetes bacterium]